MTVDVASAALSAADAEEYTQALGQVMSGGWRQVMLGEKLGVPAALGLSVEQWVEQKLGGYVRLSVQERREAVEEMSKQGMTERNIGKVLGVGKGTVARDKKPPAPNGATNGGKPANTATMKKPPAPNGATRGQLANQSGGSDGWSTPRDLFDALDREFHFDLDVCALPSSAKCERYFTPAVDGLAQEWAGVCWMNPPYGDEIVRWVAKAAESAAAGATIVALVPARVETGWWWDHCRHHEVRLLRGRLKFGGAPTGAPFPSALVVFGRPASTVYWEWRS